MDTTLQQLIETFKDIAPELWKVILAQVKIETIQCLAVAIFFTIILIVMIIFTAYMAYTDSDGYYFFVILGTMLLILPIYLFIQYYGMVHNPEYYAIKLILEQIK